MTELTNQDKIRLLIERISKLSEEERRFLSVVGYYADTILSQAVHHCNNNQLDTSVFKGKSEWFWNYSMFGHRYDKWAKDKMENLEIRLKAIDAVIDRKRWGMLVGAEAFNMLRKQNKLTPFIFYSFVSRFSQEDKNTFETYMKDPLYSVGQIVQLRSNAGVDTVLQRRDYGQNRTYYYGTSKYDLALAKKKTFMVIAVDPKIDGMNYAKAYKYKEGQGGCRYYKLLPMGEQETYYVVEKFLKKCRTRAVKDAGK
tara:strand:+ start:1795 stop:2559 length:765 start_codon:yes stop_codon:yes gene_type:complete